MPKMLLEVEGGQLIKYKILKYNYGPITCNLYEYEWSEILKYTHSPVTIIGVT